LLRQRPSATVLRVKRAEFYALLDDIVEQPAGTLQGTETLDSTERWDSLAVVSFIASCNAFFGVVLKGDDVKKAKSVEDLRLLVGPHITD